MRNILEVAGIIIFDVVLTACDSQPLYRDTPLEGYRSVTEYRSLRNMAKKAKDIREATSEELSRILGHFKLKMVIGRQTKVPGIIYRKNFNKETHTGKGPGESPAEFIKYCHGKGYVVATDGKYVRIWTSNYFTKKTGHTTKAKPHSRSKPTFEELRAEASKIHLRKWTKKKSKKALAASLRRHKKHGGHKKHKKGHRAAEAEGEAPSHKGHKKHHKGGKFARLKKEAEGEGDEE